MARKDNTTRFTVSSSNLAGALGRLKLDIPQVPMFAKLPVGTTEVDDVYLKRKKLQPDIMALAQAIAAPTRLWHWTSMSRQSANGLDAHIFSRTGKAPYVMVAERPDDLWDVMILRDVSALTELLAGLAGVTENLPPSADDGAAPIYISLLALGTLATLGDARHLRTAESLTGQAFTYPVDPLIEPANAGGLSAVAEQVMASKNLAWNSVLLSAIGGSSLQSNGHQRTFQSGIQDLMEAGLMQEDNRLTADGAGITALLSDAQSASIFSCMEKKKQGFEIQMVSLFPAGDSYLVVMWHGGDNPNVGITALSGNGAQRLITGLVD